MLSLNKINNKLQVGCVRNQIGLFLVTHKNRLDEQPYLGSILIQNWYFSSGGKMSISWPVLCYSIWRGVTLLFTWFIAQKEIKTLKLASTQASELRHWLKFRENYMKKRTREQQERKMIIKKIIWFSCTFESSLKFLKASPFNAYLHLTRMAAIFITAVK